MKYFKNLQWYRSANRCRFYKRSQAITSEFYVIMGFSWWRGRVIMREVTAGVRRYRYARAEDFVEVAASDFVGGPGQLVIDWK